MKFNKDQKAWFSDSIKLTQRILSDYLFDSSTEYSSTEIDSSDSNQTSNSSNSTRFGYYEEPEEEYKVEKSSTLIVSEIIGILFIVCLGMICLYFAKGLAVEWY